MNNTRKVKMADLKYEPVPHNHEEFLARARTRKGFSEIYDPLKKQGAKT